VDTYAFGILVYYAITKQFPEGIFDMPGYLVPHYRKNWDLLVSKCLQADPAKRPESLVFAMNEFLDAKKTNLSLVQSMQHIEEKKLHKSE
ncbi:hypothetical protein, partial [Brucella melitensis]|uniref:hypothetical protein n=1 Tax=Brucella melitensis TaxID=29459 RepID=UPI003B680A66